MKRRGTQVQRVKRARKVMKKAERKAAKCPHCRGCGEPVVLIPVKGGKRVRPVNVLTVSNDAMKQAAWEDAAKRGRFMWRVFMVPLQLAAFIQNQLSQDLLVTNREQVQQRLFDAFDRAVERARPQRLLGEAFEALLTEEMDKVAVVQ